MKKSVKLATCIATVATIAASLLSINASAITEVPQKLVETNVYTDSDGYVVNEYIWEDFSADDITPYESVTNASWIGISDDQSYGKHRSAKEYTWDTTHYYYGFIAAAQTELYDSSTDKAKYHYTRARVVNAFFSSSIHADSDRVWGTSRTTARTSNNVVFDDSQYALRSYWGY